MCSPVCFIIRATWYSTFFLLLYLPLSLVKTKGQTEIVYMEGLWGPHYHHPKFRLHSPQTSEYVSAYNSHKLASSFITLLCTAIMVSTEGSDQKKKIQKGVDEFMVDLLQLYGSNNVGSGRVCMFVTWDTAILLQGVDNHDIVIQNSSQMHV